MGKNYLVPGEKPYEKAPPPGQAGESFRCRCCGQLLPGKGAFFLCQNVLAEFGFPAQLLQKLVFLCSQSRQTAVAAVGGKDGGVGVRPFLLAAAQTAGQALQTISQRPQKKDPHGNPQPAEVKRLGGRGSAFTVGIVGIRGGGILPGLDRYRRRLRLGGVNGGFVVCLR